MVGRLNCQIIAENQVILYDFVYIHLEIKYSNLNISLLYINYKIYQSERIKMSNFVPLNWYTSGFTSPIEYFKYAADFNHDFQNVVIFEVKNIEHDKYKIYELRGVVMYQNKWTTFSSFIIQQQIIKFHNAQNNEGDFEIEYNGLLYSISTNIDTLFDIDPTEADRSKSNELIQNINLHEYIIKLALIAASLDI